MLVFDIETGPLPDEELLELIPPFVPPPHPGEFDPSEVKTGNLKDPAKIHEKIEQARQDHRKACDQYQGERDLAEKAHFEDFKASAALSATTGRVLAIGYFDTWHNLYYPYSLQDSSLEGERLPNLSPGVAVAMTEAGLIAEAWRLFAVFHKESEKIVGHNIISFDLPFLIRRSWILGVDVPSFVLTEDYRYLSKTFVDTLAAWKCGQFSLQPGEGKLDRVAKALGVEGKLTATAEDGTEVTGANFSKLYFGSTADRELALKYLEQDVMATVAVAGRLGIG